MTGKLSSKFYRACEDFKGYVETNAETQREDVVISDPLLHSVSVLRIGECREPVRVNDRACPLIP